jgi:peptidoglycan/xylan/chitin deacetylase (PgdA/CDA1 family)
MAVTLTFDNGPAPGTTEAVLDVLADRGLRATFFVVGRELERPGARALAERAVADGHWIGNHSMTHRTALGDDTDPGHARREIDGCPALLGDLSHERRFFRPFGGGGILGPHLFSPAAVEILADGGYTCVLWTSVPHDWDDPDGWVETALGDVEAQDDAVVVLHDLPTGAMAALPRFLDELERRGVEVVQDFPESVVPIASGAVRDLDDRLVRR